MAIYEIPVEAIPAQEMQFDVDGVTLSVKLHQISDSSLIASVDLINSTGDAIDLVDSEIVVPNLPIIRYPWICSKYGIGNLFIMTQNDELPDYQQLGTTQALVYGGVDEWNAYREEVKKNGI